MTKPPMRTMAQIRAKLGNDHVDWLLAQPAPEAVCDARAAGHWDANLLEAETCYRALGQHLRAVAELAGLREQAHVAEIAIERTVNERSNPRRVAAYARAVERSNDLIRRLTAARAALLVRP